MPEVVKQDIDQLNAVVTVRISKDDYQPTLESKLNKQRAETHIKGFRKGKTPMSYVKKVYGKAFLAQEVNDTLQKSLSNFLEENKIDIIGNPIANEKQVDVDFDIKNPQDYEFIFDIGIKPAFEVKGADESTTLTKYKVIISDEAIEKDFENMRKRVGEQQPTEEAIVEGDMVKLDAIELEGDAPKVGGHQSTFSYLVNMITDEAVKKELLGKKTGDTIRFNPFTMEEGKSEEHVRKYVLGIEDDSEEVGNSFEGTIVEVTRVQEAEVNQAFFDKVFGEGEVNSEEEAKAKLKESLEGYYDNQATNVLTREVQEQLIELNQPELPSAFLKRWWQESGNYDDAYVEKHFEEFSKSMRWTMVRQKLAEQYEVKVDYTDLVENLKNQFRSMYGAGLPDHILEDTAYKMLQDEQQVNRQYDQLMTSRVLEAVRGAVTLEEKEISSDDFDEMVKKLNEADAAEQAEAEEKAIAPVEAEETAE